MKTTLFIFAFLCSFKMQAQIPNASFEVWDYYNTWTLEPEGWTTPNNQIINPVIQDAAAFDGELAMRVTVIPGFEGGVPQSASTFFSISEFPESLDLMVKCAVPDPQELDKVCVLAEFIYQDAIVHFEEWISYDSIPDWTEVTIPINPPEVLVNEMRITVTAGFTNGLFGGSWDTWISVDAVSISTPDFIPERNCESILFPNPSSNGYFSISTCGSLVNETIRIFDLVGREVFSCNQCTTDRLFIPEPGTYIVQTDRLNSIVIVSN